ncbi:hypothetical protein, partial [Ruegeria sp. PrR005]|uniref:hypothetical protein n=1 Tax=Ruegeria sp. PrR005 TaxID=2706882 RepID=UPI00194547A7
HNPKSINRGGSLLDEKPGSLLGGNQQPAAYELHPSRERAEEVEALNEVGRQRETISVNLDRLDGLP